VPARSLWRRLPPKLTEYPTLDQDARIPLIGIAMVEIEVDEGANVETNAAKIREQLDLLIRDHTFRASKRSVAFLRYVVEQTLNGSADQIKERTIGVEVFEREPSYDTNLDHVVRTAATELRKRLAIYYGEDKHRAELRIGLIPGSYIPRFTLPASALAAGTEPEIASELAALVSKSQGTTEPGQEPFQPKSDGSGAPAPKLRLILALSAALLIVGFLGGLRCCG
jgi:hypothetical protein